MGKTPTRTEAAVSRASASQKSKINMNREVKGSLKSFLVELLVYSALVVGYFFLVQHFLAGWVAHLFEGDRRVYAAAALALIVCQGIALELLTSTLFALIKPRMDDQ